MTTARRHIPGDRLPSDEWNDLLARIARLEKQRGGAASGDAVVGAAVVPFAYGASDGDVLVCLRLLPVFGGPDDVGTENYYIAKPYTHRPSVTSRGSHSYSYNNDFERVDTIGAVVETQVLTPAYQTGDIVYAMQCHFHSGVEYAPPAQATRPLTWIQVNVDGRAWAKKFGT